MAGMRSGSRSPGAGDKGGPADDEQDAITPSPSEAVPASASAAAEDEATEDATTPTRVRPTRPTPGAAGLAALMAQSRIKFGRPDDGRSKISARDASHLTPKVDTPEITVVGGLFRDDKALPREARSPAGSPPPDDPEDSGPTAQFIPIIEELDGSEEFDGSDVTAATAVADLTDRGGGEAEPGRPEGDPHSADRPGQRDAKVGGAGPGPGAIGATSLSASARLEGKGTGPNAPRVSRPMRLTPGGSARLAALLDHTRSKPEARGSPESRIVREAETQTASQAASVRPESSGGSAPIASTAPESDIPEPQQKNPKFASTLHGVPVPEITVPAPWGTVASRSAAESLESARRNETTGSFGRDRHRPNVVFARDISNQQALGGFGLSPSAPRSMEEGEPTEKNRMTAARLLGNRLPRRRRIAIGAVAITALLVLGLGIFLSQRKSTEDSSRPLAGRPSAPAPPAGEVRSGAEIVKIEPLHERLPPVAAPETTQAPIAPVGAQGVPDADSQVSDNKTLAEQPPTEQRGPSDLKDDQAIAAKNDSRISAPIDVGSSESKRKVGSQSESHRATVRKSSAKHRDKVVEGGPKPSDSQSGASDGPASSPTQVKDQPKAKPGTPGRPLEYDPDATLPLMGR